MFNVLKGVYVILSIRTTKSKYFEYKTDNFILRKGKTMKTTKTLLKMAVLVLKPATCFIVPKMLCYNLFKETLARDKNSPNYTNH